MEWPEHPIDPGIRTEIGRRLSAIEADHGVRVLYACESGSRGWGFASPDSDYDVRFIYVHPLAWYLKVSAQRDVIEVPISDELDINGWELRKALGLLKKGNATLIEWLDSPVVYRADADFLQVVREAARQTHQAERSFHHYVHMARKNYREYLRGDTVRLKKHLYVLRPLLATLWIERGCGVAPMRFVAVRWSSAWPSRGRTQAMRSGAVARIRNAGVCWRSIDSVSGSSSGNGARGGEVIPTLP